MEFTKDIYFDNSLTNGKTAKITYAGMLFKSGSEHINLVSGFGEKWENTTTTPMEKTKDGFVAEMEIQNYDTFNFCFSNENNCWDNNNGFNYVSPILPDIQEFSKDTEVTDLKLEFDSLEEFMNMSPVENEKPEEIEYGTDYSTSIDDIIEDILGNTVQNSISNSGESVDDILDSITQEAMPEIESLFNELFFENELEDLDTEVEPIQEIVTTEAPNNAELVSLFDELFDDAEKPIYFENSEFNASAFNLDGLVSDLLEPVISASVGVEESLFDKIEENTITEETSLVPLENDLQVSSRRLGMFYKMKKRISIACYKLFVKAPKALAKQLGFNID